MSFAWIALFYLAFLILPFLVPDGLGWKRQGAPWAASALAGPVFFLVLDDTWRQAFGPSAIGLLPVILAALSVIALAGITQRFPREGASPTPTGLRLRYLALFAALALGFVAVAIPLQLDRQWMTLGWALEGVAVWWLYRKLPHAGLAYFGAALFATVGVRLILNVENVMGYQPRGWPIVNWLLYTYGLAAVCCLVGGWLLREADAVHGPFADPLRARFAPGASFLGLILVFVLINLEIADYFSTGTFVQFGGQRGMARDLTTSASWALYAMLLLVLGVWRHVRPLRFVSLGFLILTVAKVFLYDLSNLTGLYQILAFLGLGVSLIVVSLFYQRFVFKTESRP